MSTKIFISYTGRDREWAQWIGVTLRDNGYVPLVHEWEVGPGENIARWMDDNLADSNHMLGVFTDEYVKALFSRSERHAAFWLDQEGRNGFLIPIEVEKVTKWPPLTIALKRLSLVGRSEADAERALLDFLVPPRSPDVRPPYPGQRPPVAMSGQALTDASQMSEALPKTRPIWPRQGGPPQGEARTKYRECNYDLIAEWYDRWYEGLWKKDEPFKTIQSIGQSRYPEVFAVPKQQVRVLDCACGTGNSYVAFHRAGYNAFGTDGSKEMLKRAKENCEREGINHRNIIEEPINWKDLSAYKEHLSPRMNGDPLFDVIVNTSNSFCHIPPTQDYMGLALQNFKTLLRQDGLLIVDTKKYVQTAPLTDADGRPRETAEYRELRLVDGSWKVRTEREDARFLADLGGQINFHTRVHYDLDRSFGTPMNRALIVLTVYGGKLFPRTFVIPYYPLPAAVLEKYMQDVGFDTAIIPANEDPEAEYRYEIVIGRKT